MSVHVGVFGCDKHAAPLFLEGVPYCAGCGRRVRISRYNAGADKHRAHKWLHDGLWSTWGGC